MSETFLCPLCLLLMHMRRRGLSNRLPPLYPRTASGAQDLGRYAEWSSAPAYAAEGAQGICSCGPQSHCQPEGGLWFRQHTCLCRYADFVLICSTKPCLHGVHSLQLAGVIHVGSKFWQCFIFWINSLLSRSCICSVANIDSQCLFRSSDKET